MKQRVLRVCALIMIALCLLSVGAAARADAEIGRLQLQRDGPGGEARTLQPRCRLFAEPAKDRPQGVAFGDVVLERRLGADRLRLVPRIDRAAVVGAGDATAVVARAAVDASAAQGIPRLAEPLESRLHPAVALAWPRAVQPEPDCLRKTAAWPPLHVP